MIKLKRTLAAAVAATGLLVASGASALPSVDIVWRGFGDTIDTSTVPPSSIVIADVVLTGDSAGVVGVGVTIFYDGVQYLSGQEFTSVNLPGMGNIMAPLALGVLDQVTGPDQGQLNGFDQATLTAGCGTACTRTLGSFKFHVAGPGSVQAAVVGGTADDIIAGGGGVTTANFGAAFITPEPTTALLVIAGLAGLGYAGRRSLR